MPSGCCRGTRSGPSLGPLGAQALGVARGGVWEALEVVHPVHTARLEVGLAEAGSNGSVQLDDDIRLRHGGGLSDQRLRALNSERLTT